MTKIKRIEKIVDKYLDDVRYYGESTLQQAHKALREIKAVVEAENRPGSGERKERKK